MFGINFIVVCV